MTALRVYDPPECGRGGVPLDWNRCRTCAGMGKVAYQAPTGPSAACETCGGHGSLKAAALAWIVTFTSSDHKRYDKSPRARCEDCGHPMSEGTWEPITPGDDDWLRRYLVDALVAFRRGKEPELTTTFYSRCDEGCRHGLERGRDLIDIDHGGEASWRQVDVRTLGWPHDLRPEKLAALCLRCYAERKR